jgi:hypothetical protein
LALCQSCVQIFFALFNIKDDKKSDTQGGALPSPSISETAATRWKTTSGRWIIAIFTVIDWLHNYQRAWLWAGFIARLTQAAYAYAVPV